MDKKLQKQIDREIMKLSKMEKQFLSKSEFIIYKIKEQRLKCGKMLEEQNKFIENEKN